jgi:hypothetical protein
MVNVKNIPMPEKIFVWVDFDKNLNLQGTTKNALFMVLTEETNVRTIKGEVFKS